MFSCANLLLRCGPLPLTSWHRQLPSPLRARYVFGASSRFTRLHHLPENSTVRIYLEKSFEISYNFERIISKLTARVASQVSPDSIRTKKLKNSQRRYFDSFVCFPPRYEIKGKNKKKKILFIFPSGSRHSFIPARNLSKLGFSRKPDFSTTQRPIESRTWNSR